MYRGVRSGFGVLRLPELVLLFLCLVFGEAFCGVEALAAPDGKRGRAVPDTVVALSLVEDDDDKGDAIFELVLLKDKAEGGDPEAQFELGRRYLQGVGLERNDVMALHWIRAAENGFMVAQRMLGKCYERGTGTAVDVERARFWYEKAADQGDEYAAGRLKVLAKPVQSGQGDPAYFAAGG